MPEGGQLVLLGFKEQLLSNPNWKPYWKYYFGGPSGHTVKNYTNPSSHLTFISKALKDQGQQNNERNLGPQDMGRSEFRRTGLGNEPSNMYVGPYIMNSQSRVESRGDTRLKPNSNQSFVDETAPRGYQDQGLIPRGERDKHGYNVHNENGNIPTQDYEVNGPRHGKQGTININAACGG